MNTISAVRYPVSMLIQKFGLSSKQRTRAIRKRLLCSCVCFFALAIMGSALNADEPKSQTLKTGPNVPVKSEALSVPDKLVVLTFDDSAITHATHVGPLLKKYGFGATFFITEGFNFTTNKMDYMTWKQIKGLHQAGFEIGNHTRRHTAVNRQKAGELDSDIAYIEDQCIKHGIPKPVSFCYPAYATSKVAVQVLKERGYHFARAGGARGFDPAKDDPLLLPQAFDGKPKSTFEQFVEATAMAKNGKIAIMTFHGIPDAPHPWVSTTPAMLERYLKHLKDQKCTVVALRELRKYVRTTGHELAVPGQK